MSESKLGMKEHRNLKTLSFSFALIDHSIMEEICKIKVIFYLNTQILRHPDCALISAMR